MAGEEFIPGKGGKDCSEKEGGWGLKSTSDMITSGRVILMKMIIQRTLVIPGIMETHRLIIFK